MHEASSNEQQNWGVFFLVNSWYLALLWRFSCSFVFHEYINLYVCCQPLCKAHHHGDLSSLAWHDAFTLVPQVWGIQAGINSCVKPQAATLPTLYWLGPTGWSAHIREVPRSADYEYEYVWVSRILTRWLSVPGRTCWQNEYEYEYNVVGGPCSPKATQGPEATQPYSTCVQAHSRSLRIHFTAEFAPFFHSLKVNL